MKSARWTMVVTTEADAVMLTVLKEQGEVAGALGSSKEEKLIICEYVGDGISLFSLLQELENMKKRLQEIEEESEALREMQAKIEKQTSVAQGGESEEDLIGDSAALAEKVEVDSRSIYVGNVDYAFTPEEVQQHFQFCGTVNRVTILIDMYGQPKGYADVEFVEVEVVQNALLLNETELRVRQLKVCPKRTNVPGMKQYRGRPKRPCMPVYGSFPRFRRSTRYMPY